MRFCPAGFLVVDKPRGAVSRAITSRLHRSIAESLGATRKSIKVGHVGTLDPLATGVLVVSIGTATRLSNLLHDEPKRYLATFDWGWRSETADTTGPLFAVPQPRSVDPAELQSVLPQFVGTVTQRPPSFSAKRVDGRRAYELARRGRPVEMPETTVQIDAIDLVAVDDDSFTIDVRCGAGTYIRSLGRDIAAACGSSAVMSALRRTRTGPFLIDQAQPPATVIASPLKCLTPARVAIAGRMPEHAISERQAVDIRNGSPLPGGDDFAAAPQVACLMGEELVALAEPIGDALQPRLVFPRKPLVPSHGRR